MIVNKIRITLPQTDKELNIPIKLTWDFLDRGQLIDEYTDEILDTVLGGNKDFEVARFSHNKHEIGNKTAINYKFFFADQGVDPLNLSTETPETCSYLTPGLGYTTEQVYYYSKPFVNSFFKLDFYNTTNEKSQTNYFTIIIPTQQGKTATGYINTTEVQVRIPEFSLDYVGDKEGFFIYWLKKYEYYNLDTFYMTAKFFDARTGNFIKMTNNPQTSLTSNAKFNFPQENFFYYKVRLNYDDFTYIVYDMNDNRVGTTSAINWYEYVNPQWAPANTQ
jgi:hypothetical protein